MLEFKRALLWLMGHFNVFASIVGFALAFDNADKSILFATLMGIALAFSILGVICLHGEEVERKAIEQEKERRAREMAESMRRMREAMKDTSEERTK